MHKPMFATIAALVAWLACGPFLALVAAEESSTTESAELLPIEVGTPLRIDVQPTRFTLDTPRRLVHLVVSGHYANDQVQDLTRAASYTSTNPAVARVEGGIVYPVGNGQADILVSAGGHEQSVAITVQDQETPDRVSFLYGAEVALTKHGCNMGACHGSPTGKGGFRLSLRAYDPDLDIQTLVRESYNRRTNLQDPDASLLLQKPSMRVPHGGGRRISTDDAGYRLLRDWIEQGCQLDPPDAPSCVKVEVFPSQRVLNRPAHTQQLLVLATFSDGSVRDVTQIASFSSSDEAVATVDENGLVVGQQRGESAVLVRFLEYMATSNLMFLEDVPGFQWNNPPEENLVDTHVFAKLQQLRILPSDLSDDEEFVRRVHLDVIGQLPTVAETEAFLVDTSADKRARLIDRLLERPEYAEFWALKWGDLLQVRGKKVAAAGVHKFHRWLVAAVRDNMPYDEFAYTLLCAEGSTFSNPAANYYRTSTDVNDCTETTSQLFMGVRIQCAKCHNHPFERWTQDNYYGISAFFNRVERTKSKNDDVVIWVKRSGEISQPRTGQQMTPWLPLVGDAEIAPEDDRRVAFADWLTNTNNPFFAPVEVNRIWGHLIGRGIVEPVDDFRESNPPSNAELLAALAEEFVAQGYDRKHIVRLILNSRTYQLSSRSNEFNRDDNLYFSHARTRMLSAEQLLDAVCQVTGVEEKYKGLPAGTRATQLPSPDVDNDFLKVFGQPPRETACACERSGDSNLSQALQMINGPVVHGKIRAETNRIRSLLSAGHTPEEVVVDLYLAALCRRPVAEELAAAVAHVESAGDTLRGLEDVCWAILNANEFLFQH